MLWCKTSLLWRHSYQWHLYNVQWLYGCRYQHDAEVKLTLQSVKGQGLCIGKVPESHRHLCVKTIQPTTSAYVIPLNNTWWACSTGLTPCIHTQVLNRSQDYCVQVRLWPKIFYHTDTEIYQSMEGGLPSTRVKREPITAITLSLLLGLGIAGTSTGITSLVLQNQYYGQLRAAIDVDIERIENSISLLQGLINFPGRSSTSESPRTRFIVTPTRGGMCSIRRRMLFLCWSFRGSERVHG